LILNQSTDKPRRRRRREQNEFGRAWRKGVNAVLVILVLVDS
jgi:hypothetical protein